MSIDGRFLTNYGGSSLTKENDLYLSDYIIDAMKASKGLFEFKFVLYKTETAATTSCLNSTHDSHLPNAWAIGLKHGIIIRIAISGVLELQELNGKKLSFPCQAFHFSLSNLEDYNQI